MAGSTQNADLLAALNQQIQAINDLITGIANLALNVEVQSASPDVNLTCTPNVTVTPQITVNCSTGAGGSSIEQPQGDENGTPPPGYEPPDENTTDRKCKVSNFIFDSVKATIDKLAIMDVDVYANVGYVITLGIVGGILGSEVPVAGTVVGAVAGVVVAIASLLVTGGAVLDLGDIQDLLSAHQEDLVNTLFNSTDATSARDEFIAALAGWGASYAEQQLVGLLLPNDLTNLLFFTIPEYEPTFDGYEGAVNCEAQLVEAWHFDISQEGWAFVNLSVLPSTSVGQWTETNPMGGGESAGHLRMTNTRSGQGCTGEWRYTYPESVRPTVGESTVFGFSHMIDGPLGVYAYHKLVYTDDSEWVVQMTGDNWTTGFSGVPAGDYGKTLKQIVLGMTNQYDDTRVLDIDNVFLGS